MNTILFTAALRLEARPIIDYFHMKKDPDYPGFDLYSETGTPGENHPDRENLVLITGTGKLKSASAISAVLSRMLETRNPGNLYMVNAGCAGILSADIAGQFDNQALKPYVITRISDHASGLDMYPEIYGLDCSRTARCVTLDRPYAGHSTDAGFTFSQGDTVLCDMEASGAFTAASALLPYENLLFMKYPSDRGSGSINQEFLGELSLNALPAVLKITDQLLNRKSEYQIGRDVETDIFSAESISYLKSALHCSETMWQQLKRLYQYLLLAGRSEELVNLVGSLRVQGAIPTPDRRRGKAVLESIYDTLLV